MKFTDLSGARFGSLLVLERGPITGTGSSWYCQCRCGNKVLVRGGSLTSGNTKSCGCYQKKVSKDFNTVHGQRNTSEYRAWTDMKTRCLNPKFIGYANYGGRGIKVCERWLNSFENFLADMGPKPDSSYTLDRKDSDGNYEPDNCRWLTLKDQQNNRRDNHRVEYQDELMTVAQLAEKTKVNYRTLLTRIRAGMSVENAVNNPVSKLFEYQGKSKTITEWAAEMGIKRRTLQARIEKGMSIKDAIEFSR